MVFQGEIEVVVGANTYHIKAGSGIDFDSKEDHAYINRGEVDALVCFMLTYNKSYNHREFHEHSLIMIRTLTWI